MPQALPKGHSSKCMASTSLKHLESICDFKASHQKNLNKEDKRVGNSSLQHSCKQVCLNQTTSRLVAELKERNNKYAPFIEQSNKMIHA